MYFLPTSYRQSEHGLTLIETLVIAPLIILLIGTFVVAIANLTGSGLYSQEKNTSAYNVQNALDDMESSIHLSTAFLPWYTPPSPQGKDNSTGMFLANYSGADGSNLDSLILNSIATNLSPYDAARSLIYQGAAPCNTDNDLYQYALIYFVDEASDTLYKRTIMPSSQTPCMTPFQRNSCASVGASPCVTKDEKILDKVAGLDIKYFVNLDDTEGSQDFPIPSYRVASITITRTTQAGGETISYTGTLRASRINVSN